MTPQGRDAVNKAKALEIDVAVFYPECKKYYLRGLLRSARDMAQLFLHNLPIIIINAETGKDITLQVRTRSILLLLQTLKNDEVVQDRCLDAIRELGIRLDGVVIKDEVDKLRKSLEGLKK